jgi:hypothetical protein
MREYLALTESVLEREARLDEYVAASYEHVAGRRKEGDARLPGAELRHGREKLYRIHKKPRGVVLPEE